MKAFVIALSSVIMLLVAAFAAVKLDLLPRPLIEIRNDTGRFVIQQLGEARRDQYVLDTRTGRIWQFGEDERRNSFLIPVPYNRIDGSKSFTAPIIKKQSDGGSDKNKLSVDEVNKGLSGTPSYSSEKK